MRKEEFYREALEPLGPLKDIKVLEATTTVSGPVAGSMLADLGAQVIRCEEPKRGDILRQSPPYVKSSSKSDTSAYYLSINRNKKGITLNLRVPEGQEIFKQLAKNTDMIIENYRPGTMDKWGIGYEDIRKIKPDIIYVSITGFGQYGPYHTKAGYDPVGQAMGGVMSITGQPDGLPLPAGNALADNLSGWQAAFASLAALWHREKTAKGQHVDASLLDSILYSTELGIMAAANANYIWKRMGAYHPIVGNMRGIYACQDGYVVMGAILDEHWSRLCRIMGKEEMIDDPRFRTLKDRAENGKIITETIEEWVKDKTVQQIVKTLEEAQLMVGPVYSFDQIIKDEHILERDMVAEVDHPAAGKLKLYGVASKFSLTPGKVKHAAPMLGQHNEKIYAGLLGLSKEKMNELKEKGII